MKASFKNLVTLLIIASQIQFTVALAATPTVTPVTPELELIANLLALQGQDSHSAQIQGQILSLMEHYKETAPVAGQQDRIQEAMVDLNLYSPAQVEEMKNQLQQSYENTSSLNNAVMGILSQNPQGAQFSGCDAVTVAGIVGGFGGLAVSITSMALQPSNGGPATPAAQNTEYVGWGLLALAGVSLVAYLIPWGGTSCGNR